MKGKMQCKQRAIDKSTKLIEKTKPALSHPIASQEILYLNVLCDLVDAEESIFFDHVVNGYQSTVPFQ